ncbi:MAG: ABC transporter permease [Candidatus Acidiferrum sp.]
MGTLIQDLRFGLRILLKNWKLASIAGFSLSVAMAVSVSGLSVFNGIMLRPPVATAPDRLVSIYTASPTSEFEGVSYPDYKYYHDGNHSFSAVAAFPNLVSLRHITHGDRDETGTVEAASDNYFSVMGIRPILGQLFAPSDDEKKTPAAVLSYSCWKRWGADPEIVGKTVVVNGQALVIEGVTPKDFNGVVFGFGADVFTTLDSQALTNRDVRLLTLIGRLRPGVTRQRASADVRALSGQLAEAYPQADKDRVAVLAPTTALPADWRSTAELISGVLIAIVLMVLLIACANVANLLLGLATGRRQEILIRAALGAARGRLIRQLLTESAILCAVGGMGGFLFASVALAEFSQFKVPNSIFGTFTLAANFQTNGAVLAMTLILILIATLVTGLTPAIYASSANIAGALSGEAVVGGTRKNVIRNTLVVIQVAVCTLVVVGFGLCLRSLHNLRDVNLGFSPRNLVAVMVDPQSNGLSEAQSVNLYGELKRSTSQLYGVQSSSLALEFPLIDDQWSTDDVNIEGARDGSHQQVQSAVNIVDGNYFATLGIPILAGRAFDSSDSKNTPEVVVINHNLAVRYWPRENPIGRQMRIQNGNRVVTVVGVAGDGKYGSLDEPMHPVIYYALSQHYLPQLLLIVRTQGDSRLWAQPVSQMVRNLSIRVDAPPFTSDDVMRFTLLVPVLTLRVVSSLGALALMLAIFGLYGAIFYSVNERKKEIGIRVALGAQPFRLVKLFLRQTAIISAVGVSIGLLLGIAATILFRSQFYEIHAVELHVLIPVALAMTLVSTAIAFLAAWPWIKVSPLEAIRHT